MRQSTFMPHSLKVLAGAMAAIASGHALAETAGRVSFVSGNVTATTSDGQSRALTRGDLINGGDRIETRGGRLQIRFTDGGFVSLQPNTVFGVDQYLYANKAPEETSLFFSLLRGGMRTITGAIGKVNKQNYKVRTPVATIGIRGTGYRAVTDNNHTLVSVGHGLVNVENVFGNITGGAGQNILATNDLPPTLTHEGAEVPATAPEGDVEQVLPGVGNDTPAVGDLVTPDGNPLLLQTDASGNFLLIAPVALANTDALTGLPPYSFVTAAMTGGAQTGLSATFDQSGTAGLLTLASNTLPPTPVFDSGTLQFHNVASTGTVSWGEFTNGSSATNTLYGSSPLGNTQFEAYVAGVTPPARDVLPPLGTATFSLLGGTTPRLNLTTAGTLDVFKMDVDFAQSNIDVRLDLTMSGEKFQATGTNIGFNSFGNTFMLSGLATTSTGSSCAPSGCSTNINGFFAGADSTQIGAAYSMFTGTGTITGAAGLGETGFTPYVPTTILTSTDLVSLTPLFSLAAPIYVSGVANFIHTGLQAQFDSTYGANRGGMLTLANANGAVFDSGTLQFSNVTTLNSLSWGEFTNGAAAIDNLGAGLALSPTQFEPYIVGYGAAVLPVNGKASYSLQGSSTPRLNQSVAATLNNFSITIDFDFALLDVAMGVTANGLTANVSGTGIAVPSIFQNGTFTLSSGTNNQLAVSGSACTSFCTADISGFFTGTGGNQIGAAYSLLTDSGTIKGVAALGSGTPSASASVLPDGKLYTMSLSSLTTGVIGGYNYGDPLSTSLTADFNANGELVSASQSYPSPQVRLQNQTASVLDTGTLKTLSWGRYANGSVLVDALPVTLSGSDSVHYVIGQETPSAAMANLAALGGTATYALNGHTTGTFSDSLGLVSDGEQSLTGTLTADFAASTLGVAMNWLMSSGNTYTASGSIALNGTARFGTSTAPLTTTGTGLNGINTVCGSGCSTSINGFFSGQQAEQIGLTYVINDGGTYAIKGAAAFLKQ